MKVLIADDNPVTRRFIRSLMPREVEEIIEVEDGTAAVFAYEQHHPDWAFMDIEMKGMDGIEATRTIRKASPHAKIIIVTMFEDVSLRQAATEAGAVAFVQKANLLDLTDIVGKG